MCGDFYTMALRIEQDKPRTLEQKRKCRWMNPTSPRQPPSSTSKIRSQAGQPMRTPSHPPPLKKWRGPWFSGRVRTHRVHYCTLPYDLPIPLNTLVAQSTKEEMAIHNGAQMHIEFSFSSLWNKFCNLNCLAIWGLSVQLPIYGSFSLRGWWSIRRFGAFAGSNSEGDGILGKWFCNRWFFCGGGLFLGLHSACQLPGLLGTTVALTIALVAFEWVTGGGFFLVKVCFC